ncbi:MAG: TIGR03960 family B12-binding radical SAM protein [Syntrophomonadaceae bacterium]|nr:TIGR03960 family B12-binding radical SAM protein [Syntrophomonadaceae bacterium]
MLEDRLRRILPLVSKPARYTGHELNMIRKPWNEIQVRMVFAFPDVYEVGMSHLGGKILYGLINEHPDFLMERAFAPWPDMGKLMREKNIPLYSLESFRPLKEFDVVGFSLQYELTYSNVLNMLDLADIPVLARERGEKDPFIIAGGPNAFNPEPMADFIDAFIIGDGEDVVIELLKNVRHNRANSRSERLRSLANIHGVYVPALYRLAYQKDGTIAERKSLFPEAPVRVKRAVVSDLDSAFYPVNPVVPYLGVIHDRAVLEVMRGCQRGCRFCQAGIIYRPVRERSAGNLKQMARDTLCSTGFDEISLASLSTADYSAIDDLIKSLVDEHGPRGTGVALPSLRADAFSVGLAQEVQRVRKTTLTFAPEAGTQRLRDVINKNVTEEDILSACTAAFDAGWLGIKLYFMLGLPTETEEDLDGIIDLVKKIKRLAGERCKRSPKIHVGLAFFVPKPHTPFQWEPQASQDEMEEKKKYILANGRIKNVKFDFHHSATSYLEGIIARGDRRLGQVILSAWRRGAHFDSWREHFNPKYYNDAMEEAGLDPDFYVSRKRGWDEILPWDFVDSGVSADFLWEERERAYRGEVTPDCREEGCQDCGICSNLGVDLDLKGGH